MSPKRDPRSGRHSPANRRVWRRLRHWGKVDVTLSKRTANWLEVYAEGAHAVNPDPHWEEVLRALRKVL